MLKVLVTPRSFGQTDPKAFEILKEAGVEVVRNDTGGIMTAEQLAEKLADCDGVILGVDPLSAEVLSASPKLKAVAKYGVGTDNIDIGECERRGIKISRTVGANANAVADYAFTLMLAVARKALSIDALCRKGDWSKTTAIDIYGKTLGLIGLGAIGKGVAKRAKGFDMRVLAYDMFWDEAYAKSAGIERAGLERIYRESDFISIHVPLSETTRDMVAEKELAMMKPECIIVNTARGGIINEGALLTALRQSRIYGAGIDAFEEEPPKNPAWFELDNVVIGSHCAASTTGATQAMGRMAAENLIRDLLG
jgi:D-3-phosphoglycerate dehydrogenase